MKYLIIGIAIMTAMAGCKLEGVAPSSQSPDTSAHHIGISATNQRLITSISGHKLTIVYNENVNLLIPAKGYSQSWAVHLTEDFSASGISGFDYTTVDASGDVDLNWVDNNLNNVKSKTITDTLINGAQVVKINVQRPFTFSKTYPDTQSAITEQNTLENTTTGVIGFSSYIYFIGVNYPVSNFSTNLVYVGTPGE